MSLHEEKMLNLQRQLRENQSDLQEFLQGLDQWETDIKLKENQLKDVKDTQNEKLPPVRNSLTKKRRKKKAKSEETNGKSDLKCETSKPKRISSYDYRAWDKFDVDKALESDGEDGDRNEDEYSSSQTDEEWEEERHKQAAIMEKDTGNQYFKEENYELAIESYSKGIQLDPRNPLLPANRAMALLKLDRFAAAEIDCTSALTLDPTYVKVYLRRGAARMGLKEFEKAKSDFGRALQLEPTNSTAKAELRKIDRILMKDKEEAIALQGESGCIQPVHKDPRQRSKKPLRRIAVEEIGMDEDEVRKAIIQTEASQGASKRLITEKDGEIFQRFTDRNTATNNSNKPLDGELRIPLIKELGEDSNPKLEDLSWPETVNHSVDQTNNGNDKTVKESVKADLSKMVSPPVSPRTSPRIPGVPTNSYQFQTDWKILKDSPDAIYQYFKPIPPESYSKLFGEALEADILMKLVSVFKDFYLSNGDSLYSELCHLTTVKRFDMIVMFLSSKEKKVLMDLFGDLEGKISDSELTELRRCYGCR